MTEPDHVVPGYGGGTPESCLANQTRHLRDKADLGGHVSVTPAHRAGPPVWRQLVTSPLRP